MQNKFHLIIFVELMVTLAAVIGIFWWWNNQSNEDSGANQITAATESSEQFAQRAKTAFQSGSLDEIKKLIFWEGTDRFISETVEESILDDLQHQFVEVQLLPPDADEPLEFTVNGIRYVPNLPVQGRIRIAYQTDQSDAPTWTSYLYGQHQGAHFIAVSAPMN